MASILKQRRDTAANWTSANPVIPDGQLCFDTTNNTFRIGDGTTLHDSLPVQSGTAGAAGGGLTDLVNDTTPQLGGNLDLNGKNITGTGAIPSANLSGALPAIDGSALTNLPASGFGVGQSWSTVTASRALGTTYTNSTGKPMLVSASLSGSNQVGLWGYINGAYVSFSTGAQVTYSASVLLVVPNGETYKMANAGGSLYAWYEYS